MSDTVRTYQTRIGAALDEPLAAYAQLMARVEHCLFADFARGKTLTDLKSSYLTRFGITARQFNSVRVQLEGKLDSLRKRLPQLILEKKEQIASLEAKLPKIKDKTKKHHKSRRLERLRSRLHKFQTSQEQKKLSLCFGSRKLFHAQYNLEENNYSSHEDWKRDWQTQRSSEFFLLGSKDETSGNQTCTGSLNPDGSITFRLRLPNALATPHSKHLLIPNVRFAYGHEVIVAAIQNCQLGETQAQAITFRFKRDPKGWRLFASTDLQLPPLLTRRDNGVIGLDINSDHLAVTETDRFGNCIAKHTFPLPLQNTTKHQTRALIGDATKQVIALAERTRKPLALEELDFQKKKAQLREKHTSYARMLSAFAYQTILTHLKARGATKGIEVLSVNPAYTSLIGRTNYAQRYGLSSHHAAAYCIGRRSLGLSEKMPQGRRAIPIGKGCHVTLDLPVRNRSRHVWHQWGQLHRKVQAALTAQYRTGRPRSSSSFKNSS